MIVMIVVVKFTGNKVPFDQKALHQTLVGTADGKLYRRIRISVQLMLMNKQDIEYCREFEDSKERMEW